VSDICLITGNHPRHEYFARKLIESGKICGWVVERREELIPPTPRNLGSDLKEVFRHHFRERERIESEFFGNFCNKERSLVPCFHVDRKELNSNLTFEFVKKCCPSLIISYGCHKISDNFIQAVGGRFWNTHGGLSPQYRGVATHFWPSYFLEPQMTGMTLHETTDNLDGGAVIFQTSAPMVSGDTLHRLAARTVQDFCDQLASHVVRIEFTNLPRGLSQDSYGRVFMRKDWRPEHLQLIYGNYKDSIVDALLNGDIQGREPELLSVL